MDNPTTTRASLAQNPEYEDKTTVAPEVLVTIARLAAASVPGVAYMAPPPAGNVRGWFERKIGDGVALEVRGNNIEIDIYLAVDSTHNVIQVSRKVQMEVVRAMEEMVGLNVSFVNIHIEDVSYDNEKRTP